VWPTDLVRPIIESSRATARATRAELFLAVSGYGARERPMPAVAWQSMTALDASSETVLEPLLCIDEVAELLRISERGVYRLMRRGELCGLKVGHRTLVEQQEVRQFIESQRRLAASSGR
jgi:excisionase family DNA binding protein